MNMNKHVIVQWSLLMVDGPLYQGAESLFQLPNCMCSITTMYVM